MKLGTPEHRYYIRLAARLRWARKKKLFEAWYVYRLIG